MDFGFFDTANSLIGSDFAEYVQFSQPFDGRLDWHGWISDTPIASIHVGTGDGHEIGADSMQANPVVPEPSTFALLGIGMVGLIGYGWRRIR